MRRSVAVAVAVVAAVLVATATPVLAANVGYSIYNTPTEFNNATTLENVTVRGSGTSAYVDYNASYDSFEDGGIAEWRGDTGSYDTQTTHARTGSTSVNATGPSGAILRDGTRQTQNASAWVYHDSSISGSSSAEVVLHAQDAANHVSAYWSPSDNLEIRVDGVTQIQTAANWQTDTWQRIELKVSGDTYTAVAYDSTGTQIASVSTTDTTYSSGRAGLILDDSGSAFADDFQIGNGSEVGTYVGQNHTVDIVVRAGADFDAIDNASATVRIEGTNGNSWTTLNSATYTTAGGKRLDVPSTYDTYRVRVDMQRTSGTDPTAELEDDVVVYDTTTPEIDNTSATPDSTTLSSTSTTLSVDVSDGDFATAQGDSVTVEFFHKPPGGSFSSTGTDSLAGNGTATQSLSVSTSGTHEWYVEATDSYGNVQRSETFTFGLPGVLNIRNESDPDSLVTESANATFYGSEGYVESRQTSSGTVSLSGIPDNQSYSVRVQSDGYVSRRVWVNDIAEDTTVYLLPENETTVDVVYVLDDNTGEYPARDSTLSIQRALNRSGTTRYETVSSDTFGASNEFAVTLEQDVRYRLLIDNNDGQARALGGYITNGDDPNAVLPIGEVIARGSSETDVAFTAAFREDPRRIVMRYDDVAMNTTDLYLNVTNVDTGTSIRSNTSVSGPFGTYTETVVLPASEPDNGTYRVEYVAVRDGAADRNGTQLVGDLPEPISRFQLGANVLFLLGWATVLGLTGLVSIASPTAAAIVAPATATLLTWLGALSVPLPLLAVAGGIGVLAAAGGAFR